MNIAVSLSQSYRSIPRLKSWPDRSYIKNSRGEYFFPLIVEFWAMQQSDSGGDTWVGVANRINSLNLGQLVKEWQKPVNPDAFDISPNTQVF